MGLVALAEGFTGLCRIRERLRLTGISWGFGKAVPTGRSGGQRPWLRCRFCLLRWRFHDRVCCLSQTQILGLAPYGKKTSPQLRRYGSCRVSWKQGRQPFDLLIAPYRFRLARPGLLPLSESPGTPGIRRRSIRRRSVFAAMERHRQAAHAAAGALEPTDVLLALSARKTRRSLCG